MPWCPMTSMRTADRQAFPGRTGISGTDGLTPNAGNGGLLRLTTEFDD
jgi:hypothetical protein